MQSPKDILVGSYPTTSSPKDWFHIFNIDTVPRDEVVETVYPYFRKYLEMKIGAKLDDFAEDRYLANEKFDRNGREYRCYRGAIDVLEHIHNNISPDTLVDMCAVHTRGGFARITATAYANKVFIQLRLDLKSKLMENHPDE